MNIYFDLNSSTLDTGEEAKIPKIISAVTASGGVTLNGFISEDEPAVLAAARIAAVDAALAKAEPPRHRRARSGSAADGRSSDDRIPPSAPS